MEWEMNGGCSLYTRFTASKVQSHHQEESSTTYTTGILAYDRGQAFRLSSLVLNSLRFLK
jgi:hypothetical protein